MKIKNNHAKIFALVFTSILFTAYSEEPYNIHFSGKLINKPNCTVSNDDTLEIHFGSVNILNINTDNSDRKKIDYTVFCDEDDDSYQLSLSISGQNADFDPDNATIRSDEQSGVGFKFYYDELPFPLNEKVHVNKHGLPNLEVAIIKSENELLSEGSIVATATLLAQYQ